MGRSHPRNFINDHCHFFSPSEFYQWSLSLFSPMSPAGFEPTTSIVTSITAVDLGCTTRPVSRLPRGRKFSAYILRQQVEIPRLYRRQVRRERCHAGDKIALGERSSPHASVYRLVTIRESSIVRRESVEARRSVSLRSTDHSSGIVGK